MSNETSEEKNLPPSQHKLRKAREKGQVVTSKEALASVSMAAVLIYLFMRRDAISADLQTLFMLEEVTDAGFAGALAEKARICFRLAVGIVLPILITVVTVSVLGGVVVSGGPVFSTHPLIPDFNKINPAGGFKKIFGRRAMMGFLMHCVRLITLLVAPALILWGSFGALMAAPPCGLGCMGEAIQAMLVPLLIALLTMLVVAMLLDYLVQRSEFMREQKMSITEFKRELKDQDGDPLLKGQMRQDQRAMVERPTGLSQATALIHDAPNSVVGLRYVDGDTPAPLVVIRARGGDSVSRILRAAAARIRISHDPAAVAAISGVAVGDYVVEDDQIEAIAHFLRPG
ncbi:EscU/YscU/HrcU family type III secretion system export apparatus switch protein [Paracoccus sediminicola]|uniref:EscU/YscU/HrcU family type III secretion system export apparatus switch protein n=1 Tax=Paracoccus sediminicola TaxID=3017783 RepID=UPI0022F027B8|nr:EscU/YscU/HrcU family type III secretion system export apparatus switch protein [Paracoccus sediminicola]WBU57189.1 EscU/YscU/HrcU family type III secretion system export apparatus switch protein [Paracoccus sediminicola]